MALYLKKKFSSAFSADFLHEKWFFSSFRRAFSLFNEFSIWIFPFVYPACWDKSMRACGLKAHNQVLTAKSSDDKNFFFVINDYETADNKLFAQQAETKWWRRTKKNLLFSFLSINFIQFLFNTFHNASVHNQFSGKHFFLFLTFFLVENNFYKQIFLKF
jgi:hypothetical protein